MMGAKVNGKIVPLEYNLQNGDIVEVLTSASVHGPSRDWLKIAKTSQARNKINQWFKKEKREENIERGKDLIERELKKVGLTHSQLFKSEWIDIILKKYSFNSLDDLYANVGYGGISASKIIARLRDEYKKVSKPELPEVVNEEQESETEVRKEKKHSNNGIIVKGIENCLVRLSRCCNPVPGDDIIGYVTRGRGVSVHRKDCTNIQNISIADEENNRIIEVAWQVSDNASYLSDIQILANDRTGFLAEVTNCIAEAKIPLKGMNARTTKEKVVVINLTLEISNTEQLDKIIKKLRKLGGVFEVNRSRQ